MNILIFDPDLCQSIAIAKYLKKYANNSYIVGCRPTKKTNKLQRLNNISCYDRYITHEIDKRLLSEWSVVIPTGGQSTLAFSNLCSKFQLGEIEFIKENLVVSDKKYMHGVCSELNIPIPYTYQIEEKIDTFPVFYKSDHETSIFGKFRGVVKSKDDLRRIPQQGILVQEYISTPSTFGVGFIAQNGKLITQFMHEELISFPKAGGSAVILKRINDSKLLQYTSLLVDKLNYHGWGLAEYKYCTRRNDYVFMEINAKFWASFEFTLMENPLFGKLLFGLNYPAKSSNHFIYVDRLLKSYPGYWFKYLPQIVSGHHTLPGGWRGLLASVIRAIIK